MRQKRWAENCLMEDTSHPQFRWLKQEGGGQESFAGWAWPTVKARREASSNPSCRSNGQEWWGSRAQSWNTLAAQGRQKARNKSGTATVATRAIEGLLSLFKGPREEWTRQRHGSLCAKLRHPDINSLWGETTGRFLPQEWHDWVCIYTKSALKGVCGIDWRGVRMEARSHRGVGCRKCGSKG